jgi:hypothetical protein
MADGIKGGNDRERNVPRQFYKTVVTSQHIFLCSSIFIIDFLYLYNIYYYPLLFEDHRNNFYSVFDHKKSFIYLIIKKQKNNTKSHSPTLLFFLILRTINTNVVGSASIFYIVKYFQHFLKKSL